MFLSSYWVTIKTKPAMPSKKVGTLKSMVVGFFCLLMYLFIGLQFHLTAQDEEDLKQGVLHDMTNRQTDK
jgi:hypothetical protein